MHDLHAFASCKYVFMHMCLYACVSEYIYACVCVCMCVNACTGRVCVCVCVFVCICIVGEVLLHFVFLRLRHTKVN